MSHDDVADTMCVDFTFLGINVLISLIYMRSDCHLMHFGIVFIVLLCSFHRLCMCNEIISKHFMQRKESETI